MQIQITILSLIVEECWPSLHPVVLLSCQISVKNETADAPQLSETRCNFQKYLARMGCGMAGNGTVCVCDQTVSPQTIWDGEISRVIYKGNREGLCSWGPRQPPGARPGSLSFCGPGASKGPARLEVYRPISYCAIAPEQSSFHQVASTVRGICADMFASTGAPTARLEVIYSPNRQRL